MNKKAFTLQELAVLTESRLVGNPDHCIYNVADLENAASEDASFFSNPRYRQALQETSAGVIFIDEQTPYQEGKNYLISSNPSRAFQKLVETLHPQRRIPSGFESIHPTATIHETARLEEGVTIGPQAVIDEGVVIGKGTFVGAGAYVGPDTSIGTDCVIYPRVVIREQCVVGNRVIIQPGAVIGSCGFGYITDATGRHVKLNQVGNVIIEDDVEIGANTTIDRARFKSTVIRKGTKLDNLVQIGHGVELGAHNMIIAQTGIAGSSKTGKYVVLAGQVAVAGHLTLADGVMVAGKSGVTKSLPKGKYGGIPAVPIAEYNRNSVYLRNIEQFIELIRKLEKNLTKE